ncbi:glycoside hydrolase family 13 and glycosyltransferase family 5 protein [Lentinula raphanica]|nr:glycoside hydrolase family 13 and glycosyltransferase family 5 protein [Lentinula raphanica]
MVSPSLTLILTMTPARARSLFGTTILSVLLSNVILVLGSPYNSVLTSYNLNLNKTATSPLDYYTNRSNTTYTDSPQNWRSLPIYTVLLDKLSNGDPSNDDFFGTPFESDPGSPGSSGGGTQLRFGGDLKGLGSDRVLDYLEGMGVGVIYVAGTGFLNEIWEADGYSPLDFSVLDPHWGTWDDWVAVIDKIHDRGMYFMADFTVGTMSDLIGFKGFLNTTAPFTLAEYEAEYLNPSYIPWNFTDYKDFEISNTRNTSCVLPQFWNDDGTLLANVSSQAPLPGCLESDFDQYGSIEAFGVFPDWQRQLSKFAGVQDRLREWKPGMIDKLTKFSCMVIQALDIDAIRVDKSLQVTVDALAEWSKGTRECAKGVGKGNFYVAGEVTGGDTFGALYLGRGRTPAMRPDSIALAGNLTSSDSQYFLREEGLNALDGCAFHYSIYRSLTSFLGMDGNLLDAFDLSSDSFITAWNEMFVNDDFINPNTGQIDPRHMYGTSNFDVFRWPSLSDGVRRGMLGSFVTALVMPGVVMYYYGEEQDFYIFDSTANNYLYGRQAMPSSLAWLHHGCYHLGSQQYFNMPLSRALLGCSDPSVPLDHFDVTSSTRLLFTQFNFLRSKYAVLEDGFALTQLGNWTDIIERPGSGGVGVEVGLWSLMREGMQGVQLLNQTEEMNNNTVWMFMTNVNVTQTYSFDCLSSPDWIKAPYPVPPLPSSSSSSTSDSTSNTTTVRSLLYPFETYTLVASLSPYFNDGNAPFFGCLQNLTMDPYGFKVLVLEEDWVEAPPVVTAFWPGHDTRIVSTLGEQVNVDIALGFSQPMDCDNVTNSIVLNMSSSGHGSDPSIANVSCLSVNPPSQSEGEGGMSGIPQTIWIWNATLVGLPDGVLEIKVVNPASSGGVPSGATDHLLLRKGLPNNVMIFPENDYNSSALVVSSNTSASNTFLYTHSAFGADSFRYSLDFGITWTNWTDWEDITTINTDDFSKRQNSGADMGVGNVDVFWDDVHLIVQYWSQATLSSAVIAHADSGGYTGPARRLPGFLARGDFNEWGNNLGVNSRFTLAEDVAYSPFSQSSSLSSNSLLSPRGGSNTLWELKLMTTWPTFIQLSPFASSSSTTSPDSPLSTSYTFGDTDSDSILDRLPPNSESPNYLNLSSPPYPYLSYSVLIDDTTMRWGLVPRGRAEISMAVYVLLLIIPVVTGALAVGLFVGCFYGVVENKFGVVKSVRGRGKGRSRRYLDSVARGRERQKTKHRAIRSDELGLINEKDGISHPSHPSSETTLALASVSTTKLQKKTPHANTHQIIGWPESPSKPQRTVLIATLEYEILPFPQLKVKIGGLGVMSSLMGKSMTDVSLIWVAPKVGDLVYPANLGDPMEPIEVVLFGETYLVEVEVYVYQHITYVLLDSPVFRAQTKADPYPERMDDLSSAIFYSTWNQSIASVIRRFPQIDIYHINDYHGALAPLYLLPKLIPVCLSLHNAEFQGLWPLRTPTELSEVCAAFNLPKKICVKYVQLGNTFNLLHAGAEYISKHQGGVGVAGVSEKYGKRSWARYPALWTLKGVEALPNPDPTDIADLEEEDKSKIKGIKADMTSEAERARPELKRQAQEWAGIEQNPNSNLFVFVGRWSKQKGVDLIADVMPSLLAKDPSIQLITIGPVIDLYGRLAALKLARLQALYPSRVYSKPEFTALPPYLFSGADFALIPSRDEPFGLVAVEFGRKGALGVGSRLGGLGLMPGWWYPVESPSTSHLLSQLTKTIKLALRSSQSERALLRARSAVQRFPVIEWRQKMEDFHKRSIVVSRKEAGERAWRESDGWALYDSVHNDDQRLSGDEWNPAVEIYNEQNRTRRSSARASVEALAPITNRPISLYRSPSPDSPSPPPHFQSPQETSDSEFDDSDDYATDNNQSQAGVSNPGLQTTLSNISESFQRPSSGYENFLERVNRLVAKDRRKVPDPFLPDANGDENSPSGSIRMMRLGGHSRTASSESIASLVETKSDSPLNKAIASFTDSSGHITSQFDALLQHLSPVNSENQLSIEKYLMKSEKEFFKEVKKERLSWAGESLRSRSRERSGEREESRDSKRRSRSSFFWASNDSLSGKSNSLTNTPFEPSATRSGNIAMDDTSVGLQQKADWDGISMNRLQIALSREIKGWPLYTLLIASGQILSATSFQTTLLTGRNYQSNTQLYIITSIFLLTSLFIWYPLSRLRPARYVLAIPWILFATAFFLIGLPSIGGSAGQLKGDHLILANVATWCYAAASAAGFGFFALNFGEEAGASTQLWILRSSIVQGSQQIWVAALWYWGYTLNNESATYVPPWWIVMIVWPAAAGCLGIGGLLFWGLPEYYRQTPPMVSHFLTTLFRRKLVIWFLISEVLRDYWLSGPYGLNWTYLWNMNVPKLHIFFLVLGFFVGVWAIILAVLSHFSKTHTWLLPVFAVGLGAPRWCQMLWATSSLGTYLPWGGTSGPYLGITLWLWLGILDAIQGIGLGMILLQTLSRLHVLTTLAFSQIIGAAVVMLARATSPDGIGPGNVFPNFGIWDPSLDGGIVKSGIGEPIFWIALGCQLIIIAGYFWFYRKEELARP